MVDFVSVRDFSVMNLADWAITCGGVLIVVLSLTGHELGDARRPQEQTG